MIADKFKSYAVREDMGLRIGPGTRGCPPGYHWGNYTRACFPNR